VKPREVRKEQRRRITWGGKRESDACPTPTLGPPELLCWSGSVCALVKRRGVEASELASSKRYDIFDKSSMVIEYVPSRS